jgi:hypothetical protein
MLGKPCGARHVAEEDGDDLSSLLCHCGRGIVFTAHHRWQCPPKLDTGAETAYLKVPSTEGSAVSRQVDIKDREKVMKVISEADSRDKFRSDPQKTLRDAGVREGPGLDELVKTLRGMSKEELAAVSKVNSTMVNLGLTEEGSTILGKAV